MKGVVVLPTGAWFDPDYETNTDLHGNPNVLTKDIGTSELSQGPTSHTCLVEIKKAKKNNLPFGIMTFEPVPVMFFNSKIKNHRINSLKQKKFQLKKFKIDFLIIIKLNKIF